MTAADKDRLGGAFLAAPLVSVIIVACLCAGAFLVFSQRSMVSLLDRVENQYRRDLINIVSVALNAVEPVLAKLRSGELRREEAIRQIRDLIRNMTYTDEHGRNYMFMSSYDGMMLVQPFEPEKELTNQWDLQDVNGFFIIRELVKAAKTYPNGSFLSYQYFLPQVHDVQQKMAYVVGLPELECYIGTGMYMKRAVREQKEILTNLTFASILFLLTVISPVFISVFFILNRNRRLLAEIGIRRKVEEELKKGEEKYRSIFENSIEGIFQSAVDGRLLSVNPAFARTVGYESPREMISGGISSVQHYADPEDREKVLRVLEEEGFVKDYSFRMICRDGSFAWVSLNARAVKDSEGKTLYYEGTLEDITRRKEAERIVREQEEFLREITRNIPSVVYQFYAKDTGEYGISYISERSSLIFGLHADEGKFFPAFLSGIHQEDRERFMGSIRNSVERCVPWEFEGRFIRSSGEVMWFQGLSTPVRRDDRIVFDGIMLDITERKRAEERLSLAEEKFAKIFMTTPESISISRMSDGRMLEVNQGFEDITGWKREEILGLTSREMSIWVDPGERAAMVEELSAGRDVLHHELQIRRKDGSLRDTIYSARSITIAGESCLIMIVQDITEWKRLEDERRKLEQQFYQSQKMDAIGQLAGGVAHDFNNILMSIQGSTTLMLMDHYPEHPHCQRLTQIEEEVQRGARLTRQLLGFAREGKYELRSISVNDLVRKSTRLFVETRREIEVHFDLEDNVYPIEADAGQIEQVLLNIYINAGHAMPNGGRIDIQTGNLELIEGDVEAFEIRPGDYVRIRIADNGIGMDEETLKRIFEPFFTTRLHEGGSGLGLASAYGIIRNHGGIIRAYSMPGQGATFHIFLPAAAQQTEPEELPPLPNDILTGSGKILVVDDESIILDLAEKLLERLGYSVYKAQNGKEAVAVLREMREGIDLVILDMILEGTSGAQVLMMLKEIAPDVKVILSSGYGLQGEVRRVMEMGCLGFIQKPYNLSDLSRMIHQVLNSPASTGAEQELSV